MYEKLSTFFSFAHVYAMFNLHSFFNRKSYLLKKFNKTHDNKFSKKKKFTIV